MVHFCVPGTTWRTAELGTPDHALYRIHYRPDHRGSTGESVVPSTRRTGIRHVAAIPVFHFPIYRDGT